MTKILANRNWNERYLTGDTPWIHHDLMTDVIKLIQMLLPKKSSVLEVGCGYGKEAIALAKCDYAVTAVDLSEAAIQQAKKNVQAESVDIHFAQFDILHDQNIFAPFDLAFDISVLHTMENAETRNKFADHMAKLLKPNGIWINVSCLSPDIFAVEQATGVKAPPALTRQELKSMYEKQFQLNQEALTFYRVTRQMQSANFPALISVLKKNS